MCPLNWIIFSFLALFFLSHSNCLRAEDNDRFRFAVMGCMHAGLCDFQDYESAVKKIKEYNPDFVLFLSSMVDMVGETPIKEGGRPNTRKAIRSGIKLSQEDVESRWQRFDRITERLGVPVYDVPSERCIPANNLAVTEKAFLKRYGKRYYAFEYKNNLFICLDSESHNRLDQKKRGLIDGKQLDFLKSSLADISKYNNVFITIHMSAWHPEFSTNSKWNRIVHPLINGKVGYVFGACLHRLDFKKKDEVNYITSAAAPTWLSPTAKPAFFHFLIVDVDENNVSIKAVPVRPVPIEQLVDDKRVVEKRSTFMNMLRKIKRLLLGTKKKSYAKKKTVEKFEKLSGSSRMFMLQPHRIVKLLDIKEGMTVIDIGAGSGIFTFPLADALNGTGEIFATDVDPNRIEYIRKKAERDNYKNIFPVLVSKKGVDPFYKKHEFDIIFLCDVYELIHHPEEYMRGLVPSLKKGSGRLYLVYFRQDSDFTEIEFDDFKKTLTILAEKGEGFPIFKKLREKNRDFMKNWTGAGIPPEVRTQIIEDFNSILMDRDLFYELLDYYVSTGEIPLPTLSSFIKQYDRRLSQWLVACLEKNKVFEAEGDISAIDKKRLRRLNRILITNAFGNQRLYAISKADSPLYLEKECVISELKNTGYAFIRSYDFLPYHDVLEFKRRE